MASITIRNLEDDIKTALRVRAANNGRSMEEEARQILKTAISKPENRVKLGDSIHRRFAVFGGFDLDLPEREPMPEPPRFD